MNNVAGIDVSKGKSMVSVLRPFGEVVAKPFSIGHTGSELKELADYLKSLDGETRVVMEHTGRYYEPVARFLHREYQGCKYCRPLSGAFQNLPFRYKRKRKNIYCIC